jgi:hypothetical protein
MVFLITFGFLVITLGLIAKYRSQLADFFFKLPVPPTGAAIIAALVFSVIEEASINIASGTVHVLVGTVPPLVFFVFAFGKLGQIFHAKTIRYPLIALMFFGIFFEAFAGGSSERFQNPDSAGILVFGVVFCAITYAYTSIVGLTVMIERKRSP